MAWQLLRDDGEDALQESYAAALERPSAPQHLRPWLAGAVRRLALRWRRDRTNRRMREVAVARGDVDTASDPRVIPVQAEAAAQVARAVRELDEPFRTVVVLRFWRGLAPEQIAAELGVPR